MCLTQFEEYWNSATEFPYRGTYPAVLNSQGGFTLPPGFREVLFSHAQGKRELVFLFLGTLRIYGIDDFERRSERDKSLAAQGGRHIDHALYRNRFMSEAATVTWDDSSEVLIPRPLLSLSGFRPEDELSIVGVGGWIEVWKRDDWIAEEKKNEPSEEVIAHINELLNL